MNLASIYDSIEYLTHFIDIFFKLQFGIALVEQGPKVKLQGLQRVIFDSIAGIVGAGLIGTTAYVFFNKEIAAKNNDLSKEINDINESDDTVYVTAPDGKGGELA